MKHWLGVVALLSLTACGSDTPTAPSIVQVGGLWAATVQTSSVAGGECVGATIQAIGAVPLAYTLQITQTASALTAVATATATGAQTNFSGTAGTNTIVLNAISSTAGITFGYHCANGALRDLQLTAGAINATINGTSGTGTYAQTLNVFFAGTQTGVTGGILTTNSTVTMTRQ